MVVAATATAAAAAELFRKQHAGLSSRERGRVDFEQQVLLLLLSTRVEGSDADELRPFLLFVLSAESFTVSEIDHLVSLSLFLVCLFFFFFLNIEICSF